MKMNSKFKCVGEIEAVIETLNNKKYNINFTNTLLRNGQQALAAAMANDIGDSFEFYVNRMIFGDGGTSGGTPKFVDTARNGLFGATRVNKNVIANINPANPSQVSFTSVIKYDEGNGYTINEMALVMANGELYSMATFPDLGKTSSMQITWVWRLSFI